MFFLCSKFFPLMMSKFCSWGGRNVYCCITNVWDNLDGMHFLAFIVFVFCWKFLTTEQSCFDVSRRSSCSCCLHDIFSRRQRSWEYLFCFSMFLFCFFFNKMLPFLPKSLVVYTFFFFWRRFQRFFHFLVCEKEERLFCERLSFLNKGCCF